MRTAEHPRPNHVLAHLSDTHLRDPADPRVRGVVDPRPALLAALEALAAHFPEAIVLTGDLSDDGTPGSYADLRRLVEPVAERLGAALIWVNGNHDDRAAFRSGLLDEPAPEGTILAMHHSPLPVVQDLAASWELLGQQRLAEVIAGSDVRAILGGHFHQSGFGTFAGVGVHAATSLCYTQDLATGRGIRGQDGAQAWHLVSVHADTVTSTVAPIGDFPTVIPARSPEDSAARLADRGVLIPG